MINKDTGCRHLSAALRTLSNERNHELIYFEPKNHNI